MNQRTPSSTTPRALMARVVTASVSGALLEWYDFFVYGTASALFFGQVFFPEVDPTTGVIASFAAFGAGFLARPIGGLFFGHIGDAQGRKKALMWTLGIVGVATFLIGCLPTYEQIGIGAPILLVILRLAQGFGLGGEYGGAALLTIESAPAARRGFFGSLPQTAASMGILAATGVISICNTLLDDTAMHTWGWRIPFFISALMLIVGMYVRRHVEETPEFKAVAKGFEKTGGDAKPERPPILQIFKDHPKDLLFAFCARLAETVSSNIINAFGISYVATQLALERQIPLNGMLVASAIGILVCPLVGYLGDKLGLKKVYLFGAAMVVVIAFPFFFMLNTLSTPAIWVALIVAYNMGPTVMFAVQPTLFAQMFGPDVRYTGLSIAYQFSAILGGLTPMICAALIAAFHGAPWGVATYMAVIALISFIATSLIKGRQSTFADAVPEPETIQGTSK